MLCKEMLLYGISSNEIKHQYPRVYYSSFEFEDIQSFQPPWKILQKCMGDDLFLPCTSSGSAGITKDLMEICNKLSLLKINNVGFVTFRVIQ
jgi:hypothetical protein